MTSLTKTKVNDVCCEDWRLRELKELNFSKLFHRSKFTQKLLSKYTVECPDKDVSDIRYKLNTAKDIHEYWDIFMMFEKEIDIDNLLSSYRDGILPNEEMNRVKDQMLLCQNEEECLKIYNDFYKRYDEFKHESLDEKIESLDDCMTTRLMKYFSKKFCNGGQEHAIHDPAWKIRQFINGESISWKDQMLLLTADCQSGKTFIVITMSIIYLSIGITPILVVRNIKSDKDQLIFRLKQQIQEVQRDLNIDYSLGTKLNNIIYVDGNAEGKKAKKNCEKLAKALNGEENGIIISLSNGAQLEKVHKYITTDSKYILFLDEADTEGGYGHTNSVDNESVTKTQYIRKIINESLRYIAITATGQNILVYDHRLHSNNIVYKQNGEAYRGFNVVNFEKLSDSIKPIMKNEKVITDYIKQKLEKLSEKGPFKRHNDIHPVICIFKYTRYVDKQSEFLDNFSNNILTGDDKDKWTVLTLNGRGVKIYSSRLKKNLKFSTVRNGETINTESVNNGTGIHNFKKINISEVLNWMADKSKSGGGGVENHHHIAIIGWDLLNRGISISSASKNANWHPTDMIFVPSKNSSSADYRQAASRLFGNHNDNIPLTLHTTPSAWKKVVYDYKLHELYINNICNLSSLENKQVCAEVIKIPSLRMPRDFLANRSTKKAKQILNILSNPDDEKESEMVKNSLNMSDMNINWNPTDEEFKILAKQVDKKQRKCQPNTIPEMKIYIRQAIKNKTTKKGKLYRSIKPESEGEAYTKEALLEIIKNAGYEQPNSVFTQLTNRNDKNFHLTIFEKNNDDYGWSIKKGLERAWV